MFRKPLIAILALLIASGTALARPHALQPAVAVSANLNFFAEDQGDPLPRLAPRHDPQSGTGRAGAA